MEVLLVAIMLGLLVGGLALVGFVVIREGVNQAIEWIEQNEAERGQKTDA